MAKTKPELLEEAQKLKLDVTEKNTVAEINEAIKAAKQAAEDEQKEVVANREATVAKAGKRSEKSLREAEEKAEKEERKQAGDTSAQGESEAAEKKGPKPITRPRIERRGKKYREGAKLIDKTQTYDLNQAIDLALKANPSKADSSLEIHVRLGVDPRQADQNIRSTVVLPNGTGKTVRVAVFAPEDKLADAKAAGADIAQDEEFLRSLDKGKIDFDILITIPQYMAKLGKYARSLGPKGLMPNPKSGTVTADLALAVESAKTGRVEYRVDKQAIVHAGVGKTSFGAEKLAENCQVFIDDLRSQKPSSVKGNYILSAFITTTHGPSVKLNI